MKTNKTKSNNEMSYTDPTNQPALPVSYKTSVVLLMLLL